MTLQPGERVVELAAVSVSTGVVAGALEGAWAGWLVGGSWMNAVAGFFAGAAVGYAMGWLVARHFYRPGDGNTMVVRVGRGSLPATLRAGLFGGILGAMAAGVLAFLVPGAMLHTLPLLGAALPGGALIGAGMACLSSLT